MKQRGKSDQESTVSAETEGVVFLPGRASRSVIVAVSLAETTVLFANAGKTPSLAMLVDRVDDPVDPGVPADSLVAGIHQDDLVVLVDTVLVNPVRVQYSQVSASPSNPLLSSAP
jgi:hypothetical protein